MGAVLTTTLDQLATTFVHNWPFLLTGIVTAAGLKVYADQEVISRFFRANGAASVLIATLVAVATPLCSCGTMAVILGMMASSVPWAPIVAFMAASPLTSPEETVLSAGLFGWSFALALLAASVAIGLGAGTVTHILEAGGWLAGQARQQASTESPVPRPVPRRTPDVLVKAPTVAACCDSSASRPSVAAGTAGCCGQTTSVSTLPAVDVRRLAALPERLKFAELRDELLRGGAKLLVMFGGFAFVGYFINNLIPAERVAALFGAGNKLGVPFAALVGLPLYLNSDASLPMVRAFVDNGAGAGAALAFTITGAGTSLGAVGGALTIARWRVVAIVIGSLLVGAIAAGYAFDLLARV